MANTITKHNGVTLTVTVNNGTPGMFLFGPPMDQSGYGGDVQGIYTVTSGGAGASGAYRWIRDMRRSSGSGARKDYSAT